MTGSAHHQGTSGRLAHIDNLRVACMALGIFVHTSALGEFGRLEAFAEVSDWFRMATFFLVSGYFGMMLLDRRPVAVFLDQRLQALVLPLVSCLLLLNPVTLWLVYRVHNPGPAGWPEVIAALTGESPARGPMVWHLHLWFLVSLVCYVLAAPLAAGPLRRLAASRALARLAAWRGGAAVPVALTLGLVATVLAIQVAAKALGGPFTEAWLLRATLGYWPYYLLGMLLWRAPALWSACHRVDPALMALAAAAIGAHLWLHPPGPAGALLGLVATATMRCAISFALLALFARFLDRSTPLTRALSDGIYTVYLLHYLVIFSLGWLWLSAGLPLGAAAFWTIAAASSVATLGLHLGLVRRVPLLRLMLNGKSTPAPVAAPLSGPAFSPAFSPVSAVLPGAAPAQGPAPAPAAAPSAAPPAVGPTITA
ncbi:acyltransferase family protein [Frigidibacter sp. MR17.24]|uniref:acyltransferase family protein n=1 Tax=Frigidibacter sp. MR17.24 TaxID=3127345 RepID=UPI003012E97D